MIKSKLTSLPFGGFTNEPSMIRPVEAKPPKSINNNSRDVKPNPFKKQQSFEQEKNKFKDIMENPLTQMGLNYTKTSISQFVGNNKSFVQNYVFNAHIKQYFDLDQATIAQKLKFIMFPFRTNTSIDQYDNTVADFVTKAEFYIPTMAMISFVLLVCFHMILNDTVFDPSNIANDVTKCFILSLIEGILTKFVFFLSMYISLPFIDVVAYSCYKYVG